MIVHANVASDASLLLSDAKTAPTELDAIALILVFDLAALSLIYCSGWRKGFSSMQNGMKVPTPTLERLATYLTILTDLKTRNVEMISSTELEERTGINAAQFRKDLSYFGEFGRPGIGYNVKELHQGVSRILKLEGTQPVLLVGAGNLGRL